MTAINTNANVVYAPTRTGMSYNAVSSFSLLKKPKRTAIAIAVASALSFTSLNAGATGFPTVDLAALVQRVLAEVQDLTAYGTQLEQQVTQQAQLVQAVDQYQQMLTNYNHYLTMVRSVTDFYDTAEATAHMGVSQFSSTLNPFGSGFNASILTNGSLGAFNSQLNRFFPRSRDKTAMDNDISSFGGPSQLSDNADQVYTTSQLAAMQASAVKDRGDDINERIATSESLNEGLSAVIDAPESQVATLQLMATQNQAMQSNLQTIAKIENDQLNYSSQLPNAVFSNMAVSQDREVQRLKKVVNNPPVADDDGIAAF